MGDIRGYICETQGYMWDVVCVLLGYVGRYRDMRGIYGDMQDLPGYTGVKRGYTGSHNLYHLFVAQCNKRMIQIMTHSLLHAACHPGPQTKKDDTN